MPVINVSLPSDATTADVADYNVPIQTMLAIINGQLDDANIASLSGTKITAGTLPQSALNTSALNGWITGKPAPTAVVYNGNRSYTLTYAASILTYKWLGYRSRFTRTVSVPLQSTDLTSASSQYFQKTTPAAMTFVDDFVSGAYVKLKSYPAAGQVAQVGGRTDGTSGWMLWINEFGQVVLNARNAGAANFSRVSSYQSIPLNKWVHITAQLDMSAFTATPTTSYVMIDGVDVPAIVARGGTNPTALVQAGNLEIGRGDGSTFFLNGKVAQFAVYNAKVTQATVRSTMTQGIIGTETSLISAYSFNNSLNDLNTTNANNLTAFAGALATSADSPFGNSGLSATLEYGITTLISADGLTETVQVPEGCALPTSGGIAAVDYSNVKSPIGMPIQTGKWSVECWSLADSATGANVTFNHNYTLSVPIGEWNLGYEVRFAASNGSTSPIGLVGISTSSSGLTNKEFIAGILSTVANQTIVNNLTRKSPVSLTAVTPYYLVSVSGNAATSQTIRNNTDGVASFTRAELAYL